MKKSAVLAVALLGVAACQDATSPRVITTRPSGVNAAAAQIENDYIVTFRADEADPDGQARALVATYGGSIKYVYRAALRGFAVAGLPDAAVEALSRNPRVAAIERDGIMSIVESGTQSGATWGLDRIDQRSRPLDGTYGWDSDGSNVTAYILDTGIRADHAEFATNRVSAGYTAINDGNGTNDCHGHGTHVAGTVGGATYGVAKKVNLVAVRVLGCGGSGTTSGVIAGIDWVRLNHAPNAVANMSLGGSFSSALNTAVTNAVAAGVTFAVAAGNENSDACFRSPASATNAITVASTTSSDAKSSFSNWGTCVEINAPGSSITSAYITSSTATAIMSGTSMASPHVAGAAALYLSANPGASPATVASNLLGSATENVVTGLPAGTPNRLLYTHFSSTDPGPGPDPEPAPVAVINKSCTLFSCTFTAGSPDVANTYTWNIGGTSADGPGPHTKSFAPRTSALVTLEVTGPGGTSNTSTNVNCNPKKCQ